MYCTPKEIFEPQEFLENLTCSIGKGILRDPVALPCQHVFCRKCIENSLSNNSKCPICLEPATLSSIKPQLEVADLLNQAPVKCPQCGWTGAYQTYCIHEQKCFAPALPCPQGCGIQVKRLQLGMHLATCRFRRVNCKDCFAEIFYQELVIHEDVCPEKVVECPNHCGAKVRQSDKAAHLANCKAPKSNCTFGFCGCSFNDAGDVQTKEKHQNEQLTAHIFMLGSLVSKLKTKTDVMERTMATSSSQPPSPTKSSSLNIVWSTGSKAVNGDRSGWSFFLTSQSVSRNFVARVRISTLGDDANTWKICLGLFNSKQFQPGSWEKYRNGYGYILGTGCKVHEGGPQAYGGSYKLGDIISIEFRDGNITFHINQKSQGIAYSKVTGPCYLAVALSDVSHQVEILDVIELD